MVAQVSQTLLEVDDLTIGVQKGGRRIQPVDSLSLTVRAGETLGIVGESGSGKSLTLRALMGILPSSGDTAGTIDFARVEGVDRPARAAMIFQEPMLALNPTMRVGDFIAEVVRAGGAYPRAKVRDRVQELMIQVGIPEPERRARMWPHELSGGLRQRVMIAAALATDPDLLLCDEPTTALDVTIQAQILALLKALCRDRGMGMIFVSHDLAVVGDVSDRIAVMYAGRIVEVGDADDVLDHPAHPYTAALLASTPSAVERDERLATIAGSPPDPANFVEGCRFVPRCAFAREDCVTTPHRLRPVRAELTACIHPEVLDGGTA
jgi:oligopeptide/dipeptide ABC transporter ATP-binding protein